MQQRFEKMWFIMFIFIYVYIYGPVLLIRIHPSHCRYRIYEEMECVKCEIYEESEPFFREAIS